MTLDFHETCIVNQTLFTSTKEEYLSLLQETKIYTEDPEIIQSINSLVCKLKLLDEQAFQKLCADRAAQRIFTFPPYIL